MKRVTIKLHAWIDKQTRLPGCELQVGRTTVFLHPFAWVGFQVLKPDRWTLGEDIVTWIDAGIITIEHTHKPKP